MLLVSHLIHTECESDYQDSMDMEEWKTIGWVIAKPHFLKLKSQSEPEVVTAPPPPPPLTDDRHIDQELDDLEMFEGGGGEDRKEDHHHHHQEEEEEEDDEEDPGHDYSHPEDTKPAAPQSPADAAVAVEYDEETKVLMEEARKAKEGYNDADSKWNSLRQQVQQLESSLETDVSRNHHPPFFIHTLCLFDSLVPTPASCHCTASVSR